MTTFIAAALVQSPLYLAWLVALVFALVTWKRNPKPSLLTVIALLILMLVDFSGLLTANLAVTLHDRDNLPVAQIGLIFAGIGLAKSILSTGAWGLVIAAIFGWRRQ